MGEISMSIHSWFGGTRKRMLGVSAVVCLLAPPAAVAQTADPVDPVVELRQEIETLRKEYDERLAALEARLARLEAGSEPVSAESGQPEEDELASLRAAAETAGGTPTAEAPDVTPEGVEAAVAGSERNLNRLNPEISMTGDMVGFATDHAGEHREDFNAREFELNVQSALDPFSVTKLTLAFSPEEGVDI